jgi:hypothetical protein
MIVTSRGVYPSTASQNSTQPTAQIALFAA